MGLRDLEAEIAVKNYNEIVDTLVSTEIHENQHWSIEGFCWGFFACLFS